MKNILLSTRPQWCEKICHEIGKEEAGKPIYEKRIEVRKTAPKEVPFKCYIYETQGRTETPWIDEDGHFIYKGRGQVIGEFICNKVDEYTFSSYEAEYRVNHLEQNAMCLNQPELIRYGKGNPLYGWHIYDLKIYDKPKELSEFYRMCKNPCNPSNGKILCITTKSLKMNGCDGKIHLTRPPQSYMFVEEIESGKEKQ